MANYYTKASFILPLSEEQKSFALSVIDCVSDEEIDFAKKYKTKAAKQYDSAVFTIAKKLAKSQDDYEQGCFYLGFAYESDNNGIWISHDECINTNNAALFCHLVLKHFDINEFVTIEASHTCSRPHVDAFGGHAAFVTKKGVQWMSTHYWIQQQITKFMNAA